MNAEQVQVVVAAGGVVVNGAFQPGDTGAGQYGVGQGMSTPRCPAARSLSQFRPPLPPDRLR